MPVLRTISNGDGGLDVRTLLNRRMAKPALLRVLDAVRSGQSQVWQIFSDSTGVQDASTRWPFIVAQAMAAFLGPLGARVVFHQLRGTSEPTIYSHFKPILLSNGSAGPRGVEFRKTGNARSRQISTANLIARAAASDDFECIVAFDPTDANPVAAGVIGGRPGAGAVAATTPSTRGWYVQQETNGDISLIWFAPGTGSAGTFADGAQYIARWTAAQLGIVPGTPRLIKFTVDMDNGSSDWTALAYPMNLSDYPSSVGVTNPATQSWGTGIAPNSRTGGGAVATMNTALANMEIGARGNLTAPFYGKVYAMIEYDGINGPMTNSPNIDEFGFSGTGANSYTVGSPTLEIYNGAAAGKDFAWFAGTGSPADALRPLRIMTPGANIATISTGHNEASRFGADMKTPMDTWMANVLARSPMAALHMILQNPELVIASDGTVQEQAARLHAQRQRHMANYARTKGFDVSDVYSGFVADPRWNETSTVLMSSVNPAVHPTAPEGYTLEASIVAADFGLTVALV